MKVSLRTLNEMFKIFVENHPQINQYKNAPEEDLSAANLKYPLMWLNLGITPIGQGTVNPTVSVMFLDRILEDKSNYIDTMSSTLQIALDFYTEFNENENKYDIEFDVNSEAVPIVMDFDDNVNGYKLDIDCQIRNYRDENAIPRR